MKYVRDQVWIDVKVQMIDICKIYYYGILANEV